MLPAYPAVVHVIHKVAVDLEDSVSILHAPALGQPSQFHLPDDVALAAQLLVEAEAKGLCTALAQEIEARLSHALIICVAAQPMSSPPAGILTRVLHPVLGWNLSIPTAWCAHLPKAPLWESLGPQQHPAARPPCQQEDALGAKGSYPCPQPVTRQGCRSQLWG